MARDARAAWRLGAVNLLLILARPEALIWVPLVTALFYVRQAETGRRARSAPSVVVALSFVVPLLLLISFRLSYFGFPLPNTYYAKVSPSLDYTLREGARYFLDYIRSGPVPLLCVVALLASVVHLLKVRFRDTRTLALTSLATAGLVTPILAGGDHFAGFRFYQSVYPILLLTFFNCVRFIVPAYVKLPVSGWPRMIRVVAGGVPGVVRCRAGVGMDEV